MAVVTKKKWYKIIAPAMFNEEEIGETYVVEPVKTVGRVANVNLMVLTNDPKKQHINIGFRMCSVEGEKVRTEVYSYNLMPSSLRRFIRRSRDRIDDSFICVTSDNKSVVIKPLLITRFKANRSIVSSLRLNTKNFLIDLISKTKFDDFMKDVLSHKVQNQLKLHLKKIYDLKTCEMRSIEMKAVVQRAGKGEVVIMERKEEEITEKEEEITEKEEELTEKEEELTEKEEEMEEKEVEKKKKEKKKEEKSSEEKKEKEVKKSKIKENEV